MRKLSAVERGLVDGLKLRLTNAFDENPAITAEQFEADTIPVIADLFGNLPREKAEKMARAFVSLAVYELRDEMHSARSPE